MDNLDLTQFQNLNIGEMVPDIIIVAVILIVGIIHAKKGLCNCILPLVIVILSLGIGIAGQAFLSQPVTDYVEPYVKERVDLKFDSLLSGNDNALSNEDAAVNDSSLDDGSNAGGDTQDAEEAFGKQTGSLMERLGFAETFENAIETSKAKLVEKAKEEAFAASMAIASRIINIVLFAVCTILGYLILNLFRRLFKRDKDDTSVIGFIDGLGGFILGAAEAIIIILIVAKATETFEISALQPYVEGSKLLPMFSGETIEDIAMRYLSK